MDGVFTMVEGKNRVVCLVFLHGDELAAREIAVEAQKKSGFGALFFNGSTRYFEFYRQGGRPVQLDLNRIWTVGPIKLSDGQIISAMTDWGLYSIIRHKLVWPAWSFLERYKSIIALHNNGKSPYSFLSYFGELADQALDTWGDDSKNTGDFIITTKREDFERLKERGGLNVVLLGSRFDDQSLSYWSAVKKLRYFNIETKIRLQLTETIKKQQEMLEVVLSIL